MTPLRQWGQYRSWPRLVAARGFVGISLVYAPTNPTLLYNLACAPARAGRAPEALDALSRSIDAGFRDRKGMRDDPDLASVRTEPRFQEILDRLR